MKPAGPCAPLGRRQDRRAYRNRRAIVPRLCPSTNGSKLSDAWNPKLGVGDGGNAVRTRSPWPLMPAHVETVETPRSPRMAWKDFNILIGLSLLYDGSCDQPSRRTGSCTSSLRVNPVARTSSKMPLWTISLRGQCYGILPCVLPADALGTVVAVPHAACCMAKRSACPEAANNSAHHATAQALQRAQTLYRSHA